MTGQPQHPWSPGESRWRAGLLRERSPASSFWPVVASSIDSQDSGELVVEAKGRDFLVLAARAKARSDLMHPPQAEQSFWCVQAQPEGARWRLSSPNRIVLHRRPPPCLRPLTVDLLTCRAVNKPVVAFDLAMLAAGNALLVTEEAESKGNWHFRQALWALTRLTRSCPALFFLCLVP